MSTCIKCPEHEDLIVGVNWTEAQRRKGDYRCLPQHTEMSKLSNLSRTEAQRLARLVGGDYKPLLPQARAIVAARIKGDQLTLVPGWLHTATEVYVPAQPTKTSRKLTPRHEPLMQRVAKLIEVHKQVRIPGIPTDGIEQVADGLKIIEGKPARSDIDAISQAAGQLHRYNWLVREAGYNVVSLIVASEHELTSSGKRFLATTPFEYMRA